MFLDIYFFFINLNELFGFEIMLFILFDKLRSLYIVILNNKYLELSAI